MIELACPRKFFAAATSILLIGLVVIALSTQDGSTTRRSALEEAVVDQNMANEAQSEVNSDLQNLPAVQAGSQTGSVPTDEQEAQAIMGANGPTMEQEMTEAFNNVDGSHSDDASVADAIIDAANKDNIDVTGKVGATTYQAVLNGLDDKRAAWLRGSLPNYRAESKYITSGVTGNYEKELENAPTMAGPSSTRPRRMKLLPIVGMSCMTFDGLTE
eukprot:766858-Hanusia_phi.AAC.5